MKESGLSWKTVIAVSWLCLLGSFGMLIIIASVWACWPISGAFIGVFAGVGMTIWSINQLGTWICL
jgi:hypothetical protein